MKDLLAEIAAIHRAVRGDDETITVVVSRRYPTEPADVWDAITDPARVQRWFLPLTGDLRTGGSFQLEGNAGGDILACDPPVHLRVTYGGETSIVTVRLTASGADTTLELTHAVPRAMAGSVAGALFVGPGWDGAFRGLAGYLGGEVNPDRVAEAGSTEMITFNRLSIDAWETAIRTDGSATDEEIAFGRSMALGQYVPEE